MFCFDSYYSVAIYAGVTAYNNGARGWNLVGAIFGGMLAGGAVGALIGLIAPMAGSLFTGGALAIGGGTTGLGAVGVVAVGAIVVGGTKIALAGLNILFSKNNPGMSNKPPVSWTDIDEGISIYDKFGGNSNKAAEYLLNNKYGKDMWYKGAGSEFNALKKWFDRIIRTWRR